MRNIDEFALDEFALFEKSIVTEKEDNSVKIKASAIIRKTNRIETRRAKSEKVLFEILPEHFQKDTSYHVISHGDVDALSYLIFIMKNQQLDTLLISTWCMAMPDLVWLRDQCENYRIGKIDFVLGEIFPNQYPGEYLACKKMEIDELITLKIARNHAKIMAGCHVESGFYFAIESSSNINTNSRIEQTAIHISKDLHDHYVEFFKDVKNIDGNKKQKS